MANITGILTLTPVMVQFGDGLDVEGAEQIVLEGAAKTIARFRPIVQYEVTIRKVSFEFPDYVGFYPDGSSNYDYFPRESHYVNVAERQSPGAQLNVT